VELDRFSFYKRVNPNGFITKLPKNIERSEIQNAFGTEGVFGEKLVGNGQSFELNASF
jgi:hypothetical protein